jgi:hypothetical protein
VNLVQVAETGGSIASFTRLLQRGKEDGDQQRDDADDDEQFDQRKGRLAA